MYYVYLLLLEGDKTYIGSTLDLKRRFKEHCEGKVISTKGSGSKKLIHYEAYCLESDARRREKFLKTTEEKRLLKQQLRDLFKNIK